MKPDPAIHPANFPLKSRESRMAMKVLLEHRKNPKATAEMEELKRCAADIEHWLFHRDPVYCFTKDPHNPSAEAVPLPDWPYLRAILKEYVEHNRVAVEKARQMLLSHLSVAYLLHDAQFKVNRVNFIVGRKESDSDAMVRRAYSMWECQPNFIKDAHPAEYVFGKLNFYKPGQKEGLPYSQIIGVAQGADMLRSHVASVCWVDEAAFQEDLSGTLAAAMPASAQGGKVILVSSASPGDFQRIVETEAKHSATLMRGLSVRMTKDDWQVVRVEHWCDPKKDPQNDEGAKWVTERKQELGDERTFRREYCIDYGQGRSGQAGTQKEGSRG